jgi:heme exporter protein D
MRVTLQGERKMAALMMKEAAFVLVAIVDLAVAATLVAIVLLAVRSYVRKRSHS